MKFEKKYKNIISIKSVSIETLLYIKTLSIKTLFWYKIKYSHGISYTYCLEINLHESIKLNLMCSHKIVKAKLKISDNYLQQLCFQITIQVI